MTKHEQFAVKIYQWKSAILALIVATILMTGLNPAGPWRSAAAVIPEIWGANK